MKNDLSSFGVEQLTIQECENVNGGAWAIIAAVASAIVAIHGIAYGLGYCNGMLAAADR